MPFDGAKVFFRITLFLLLPLLACGGSSAFGVLGGTGDASAPSGGDASPSSGGKQCQPCTTTADCAAGSSCAQFQGDTFCAPVCTGSADCAAGTACAVVPTYAGDQVDVCVPSNGACGASVGPAPGDGGAPVTSGGCDAGAPSSCGSLVGPTTAAGCKCSSGHQCAANGCYNGWFCDTSVDKCQAPPSSCTSPPPCGGADAGSGTPIVIDAGGPVTGTVGGDGGTVSRLFFTAVGDTRPANEDDTAGYPTAIIGQIYADIEALSPRPPFSISTGDYQFSNPSGSESSAQMNLYLAARQKFSGAFYPAMGNHECTGATASNCGQGNANGVTTNYTNFLSMLLAPLGVASPYYEIDIDAADGSWTSKFVFVAANAWDAGQASWLSGVMARATTYTFVVRHEATGTSGPPGVSPSDSIIDGFPYTLLIVGHSHTYGHKSTKEVLFGNGGAPLSGSGNYGYGLFSQRSDGAIVVDAIDYQSGTADSGFHFVVTPAGVLTQ